MGTSFRTFKDMHRAKIAWSSEDVADEYELQLQHELEMLQQKFRVLENERKAVYQQRELQMKQQKELIKNIIRENEKVWIILCLACSKINQMRDNEYSEIIKNRNRKRKENSKSTCSRTFTRGRSDC